MFSKTLNAVQQEDQKKKAITDARTELIEHMKDQFETAVSKGHLDKLFDAVPKTNKSKDKSDNEKIADFLREIGL